MSSGVNDTLPEVQRLLIQGYRVMKPHQKMKLVREMNNTVQLLALSRIRRQYSDRSEREHMLRLAALWLDRDTMINVFNWNPEKEGY